MKIMRNVSWLRIGGVAALWTIIGGAAVCGWMVGKHEATQEYAELQRRLASGERTTCACGGEFELLDLRRDNGLAPPSRRGNDAGPIQIAAPGYFHLRSLITAR